MALVTIIFLVPFYVYHGASFDEQSAKAASRILLVLFLLVSSFVLRVRFYKHPELDVSILYAYAAFSALSIFYSSDPLFSAFRVFDLLVFIWFASFLSGLIKDLDGVVRYVEIALYTYLLGFVLIVFLLDVDFMRPMGLGATSRLGGFVINPNLFAYCVLFLIAANLYFFRERNLVIFSFILGMLLFFLFMTYSRSAMIALIVMCVLFKFRDPKIQKLKHIAFFVLLPALLVGLWPWVLSYLERGHGLENLLSLGGRTLFWGGLIVEPNWTQNIIYGLGYQMLSEAGLSSTVDNLNISMAHNNFIQSLLGLGILGLALNVAFWVAHFIRISRSIRIFNVREYNFIILVSVTTFIYSVIEFGIFGPSTIIAPLFFLVVFKCARVATMRRRHNHLGRKLINRLA